MKVNEGYNIRPVYLNTTALNDTFKCQVLCM